MRAHHSSLLAHQVAAISLAMSIGRLASAQGATPPDPVPADGGEPPAPTYAPPPSFTPAPPPPPSFTPPPRRDLSWSFRWNPLDLLFGRINVEAEYAVIGPLSVVVAPQYIFADPRQDSSIGVSAKGWGFFGEVGYWIDGSPLRGYFVKAHLAHNEVTFRSSVDEKRVPETLIGIMFGQQSIHAGWFTFSVGIGVAYDLEAQDRTVSAIDPVQGPVFYQLPKGGLLKNGVDLLSQIAIGGSF